MQTITIRLTLKTYRRCYGEQWSGQCAVSYYTKTLHCAAHRIKRQRLAKKKIKRISANFGGSDDLPRRNSQLNLVIPLLQHRVHAAADHSQLGRG